MNSSDDLSLTPHPASLIPFSSLVDPRCAPFFPRVRWPTLHMQPEPDFDKGSGLVPAIVQDAESGEVLMLAYMNREAWQRTLDTGIATYFSRSRNQLWVKGETSGNTQLVKEVRIDCDEDTIVLKVDQRGGAACHEGYRSCFFRRRSDAEWKVEGERLFDPATVYGKKTS